MGNLDGLAEFINQADPRGKNKNHRIRVFCPGCFDLLHAGHVDMLQRAYLLGDHLTVGLNSDESVRRLKGPTRPIVPYEQRKLMLQALRCVDEVVPISDDTPVAVIEWLKPDVLVKGPGRDPETMPERDICRRLNCRIKILDGPPVSTTSILEKLASSKIEP